MSDSLDTSVIRFIGQLFDIKPFKDSLFHRWDTACDYIADNGILVPEGLKDSRYVDKAISVAGTVWNLSTRCQLIKDAEELFDSSNQCYMLVRDAGRAGANALFLMACGMYDNANEIRDDATYHLNSWASFPGCAEGPKVISGGKRTANGIFFVQALHLASMKYKYNWEEN